MENIKTPPLASVSFDDISFVYNGLTILRLETGASFSVDLGPSPAPLSASGQTFDFYPRNEGSSSVFEFGFVVGRSLH